MYTSSDRLFHPGTHNTLEEIAEAQERAQFARLSTTRSGRNILRELGDLPMEIESRFCSIPVNSENKHLSPSRDMSTIPEHNVGRSIGPGQRLY
ncbi:hypothetical protein MTO96_042102 [Rhipicephalus appendiculatus]